MLKTILVATDGSESAEKATELAANLAKTYGAMLVLAHVKQGHSLPDAQPDPQRQMAEAGHVGEAAQSRPPASPVESGLPPCPAASPADAPVDPSPPLETACEAVLNMAKTSAQEFGAQRIETVLLEGEPVTEILRCAEYEKADLIVMGSRGLSQFKRLLIGSVSHKLTELAPCPTLTVK